MFVSRLFVKKLLCVALSVLLLAAAVMLSACGSDNARSSATPDESAPTAAPTAQEPAFDESLLHGEAAAAELFIGSWVAYPNGKRITYSFDNDGCALFLNDDGTGAEYRYAVEGDRVTLTSGDKKRVYIWSERAVTFIADHEYGEAAQITATVREHIKDFSGYMFAQGDYLYIGQLCLCREETLSGNDDSTIVGSWTGTSGDRVTFTADGSYHYRDMGFDYDGTYVLNQDGDQLILRLPGTSDVTLSGAQWSVSGRILRLQKRYYFRDSKE